MRIRRWRDFRNGSEGRCFATFGTDGILVAVEFVFFRPEGSHISPGKGNPVYPFALRDVGFITWSFWRRIRHTNPKREFFRRLNSGS